MTTLVSSWGRACSSFPAFGGKLTHNVHFLNTGCAVRLAGHFPPCHILLDEGSVSQDRKWQFSNETRLSQGSHWLSGTIKLAHPETASDFSFLEIARSDGKWGA